MKNIIKLILISVLLISCNDDFLERYPLSAVVPENSFKTANDLKLYTNSFYNDLPGFDGIIGLDKLSDNVLYNGVPLEQSGPRLVPTDIGGGGWSWGDLRKINALVDQKILPYSDFQKTTRLSMGRNWSKATPQQQVQSSAVAAGPCLLTPTSGLFRSQVAQLWLA